MTYKFIPAIADELEIPDEGTLSRALYRDDRLRVVGFAFDQGQELTEHSAAVPALIHVMSGRLRVGLGDDTIEMDPGAWLHMEAHLAHSLQALEPSVVLLTMLSNPS